MFIVGPQWDSRLITAGRARTDIATATALSSNGTIYTVDTGEAEDYSPTLEEIEDRALRVAAHSVRLRPFVPVATSYCTYYSRRALNVVGQFDPEFSPGYGEEVDFSLRAISFGFSHVAADDVYVFHATGESFGPVVENVGKADNDRFILARVAIRGLTVAVDAENIHPSLTGTFEASVALTRRIADHPRVGTLYIVSPEDRVPVLRDSLQALGIAAQVVTLGQLKADGIEVDLAFRPYQDFTGLHWPGIAAYAHRNIIWLLDLIAAKNPHYSEDAASFSRLGHAITSSLVDADAVGVLTEHVRQDLASYHEGSAEPARIFLLPTGAPTGLVSPVASHVTENAAFAEIADREYVLVLGTTFLHKNLTWLSRVFLMVTSLGWPGVLVFAGPDPSTGSSRRLDADLRALTGEGRILNFGRVSDGDRIRLLSGAALVVTPSVTEGWGMVPFEAAQLGSVPLASRGGGLGDIAPHTALSLLLSDDAADARTINTLLTDPDARENQRRARSEKAAEFSWESSADILIRAGLDVLARPRSQRPGRREIALLSLDRARLTDEVHGLRDELSRAQGRGATKRIIVRLSLLVLPSGSRPRRLAVTTFRRLAGHR